MLLLLLTYYLVLFGVCSNGTVLVPMVLSVLLAVVFLILFWLVVGISVVGVFCSDVFGVCLQFLLLIMMSSVVM